MIDQTDSKNAFEKEYKLENAIHGNDWRVLNPLEIGGEGFTDTVSVILPCYMGQKELALTFAGLSNQTYPHHLLEVIVVDDGSDPAIELPLQLPFEASIVVQERDGFGLARARNLGAQKANGKILIFLDCDMIPEPQLVEAHSRWHHVNKFALTLGFRNHADFSGISPDDLAKANGPEVAASGKKVSSPQWIEFHMRRTKNLTSSADDLFRIATGGNLGVRKSFFESIGGFDPSFRQWGGEDIEFGFRSFNSGAVLIPERLAKAWHQGEGASPDPDEEVSLEQQRHRLSHLIPERTFRDSTPGRNFEIPMLAVLVDAAEQNFEEVCAQIDHVLASSFHDLIIGLEIPESHIKKISLERRYGPDSRVLVTKDIFAEFPFVPFLLEMPSGFCVAKDHIEYLMNHIDNKGVLRVDIPIWGEIRLAKTRALKRSKQMGIVDTWEGAGLFFGEKIIPPENIGISEGYGKSTVNTRPLGNPPFSRLAAKVIKRILTVRSFGDLLNLIRWIFRGSLNVFRRAKLLEKFKNLGNLGKERPKRLPDWIRIVGEASHFPNLRSWRGNSKGVEVVLVAPGLKKGWDESFSRSVFLGDKTGIPLAPPFSPEQFNPSSFRQTRETSRIEALSNLRVDRNFIRNASSALAIEVDRADSIESSKIILQLAAIGVPVVVKELSDAELWLGKSLVSALNAIKVEDLGDPTERERVSVEVRRAALQNHTFSERLKQIRRAAGLVTFRKAMVSVVVATKRPEMVERIIRTVKAQDYDNLELILALHGDNFDSSYESFLGDGLEARVLRFPEESIFGNVLSEASATAQGEWITKMDDDDWYGCEHISDLILASSYSNADLVGKGPEFVYLTGKNQTIRRDLGDSEVASRTLAGGTLLVRSELLKETNGWRELSKGVDVALINEAVSAGARIWRTHPFGYLLRRTEGQHTWQVDDKYFLRHADQLWEGTAFDLVGITEKY